jgi:hypothetical protein
MSVVIDGHPDREARRTIGRAERRLVRLRAPGVRGCRHHSVTVVVPDPSVAGPQYECHAPRWKHERETIDAFETKALSVGGLARR